MTIKIVNLTPHPVTIIRSTPGQTGSGIVYPACPPDQLPRAIEIASGGPAIGALVGIPNDDSQVAYDVSVSLQSTGLVDCVGYSGLSGMPDFAGTWADGIETHYIVSIVTAIGAIAAGRSVMDMLIPMGQVRDETGRIVGATGLAPAESVLGPMVTAISERATGPVLRTLLDQVDQIQALKGTVSASRHASVLAADQSER